MSLSKELVGDLFHLDTTCVSDALDRFGIRGGCEGILPIVPGTKAVGTAYTVRYRPVGIAKGTGGDFLDDVEPGQVVVIDNGGRLFATVWGDIMTTYAQMRGIAGTVIDGVCRDIPGISKTRYPIFARGRFMVTGKDRMEVDALNVPVTISNVQVRQDDFVVCDDSGVVVVPFDKAEQIVQAAIEIDKAERRILDLLEKGVDLKDARAEVGYFKLQSRRKEHVEDPAE